MSNFFDGIKGLLMHPINEVKWMAQETKDVGKPLLKGDFSEAFKQFKGTFGDHQEMMSNTITKPLLGDNKISNNSDAIAGAIIGSILAAPFIGGAMGGSAGAAGGGTGGTAASTGATAGSQASTASTVMSNIQQYGGLANMAQGAMNPQQPQQPPVKPYEEYRPVIRRQTNNYFKRR